MLTQANVSNSSTRLLVDPGRSIRMRGLIVPWHNVRTDGQVKLEGSDAPDFGALQLEIGWRAAWVSADAAERDREAADYPTGRPGTEALAGWRWPIVLPIPAGADARYWRLSIDDEGNPDGRIKIGRPSWPAASCRGSTSPTAPRSAGSMRPTC